MDNSDSSSFHIQMSSTRQEKERFLSKKGIIFLFAALIAVVGIVVAVFYFYPPKFIVNKLILPDNYQDESSATSIFEDKLLNGNLPDSVHPIFYRLFLNPNIEDGSFQGKVSIFMNCTKSTRYIVVHSEDLNLTSIKVSTSTLIQKRSLEIFENNAGSAKYQVRKVGSLAVNNTRVNGSLLLLRMNDELEAGHNYYLNMHFKGFMHGGLHRSNYTDSKGNMRWLISSHAFPSNARKIFPCFDEPRFRASFQISVARKTNYVALSNMALKETEAINDAPGLIWNHFFPSPPIATHSVIITIGDFQGKSIPVKYTGPVTKIWAYQHFHDTTLLESVVMEILRYFESYFQSKYPLTKLDIVLQSSDEVSTYPGLIFLRSSDVYRNEKNSMLFKSVAQHIANQWMSLLPFSTWEEYWLNNALSKYTALIGECELRPAFHAEESFVLDMHKSLRYDALRKSQPLCHANATASTKAAAVIRMLSEFTGKDDFKKGIRRYIRHGIKSRKVENAEESFYSSIPQPKHDLSDFMYNWTRSSGYPVVAVTRDTDRHKIRLSQIKFGDSKDFMVSWKIPLTYKLQHSSDVVSTVMNQTSTVISSMIGENEWVLFNINQTGFYRIEYDKDNWKLLSAQLLTDMNKIPLLSRLQLIDDSFELANAGHINHVYFFGIVQYLQQETNSFPWEVALKNLEYIEGILMETQYFGIYKKYMLNLLDVNATVFSTINTNDNLQLLKLKKICTLKYKSCADYSLRQFQDKDVKSIPNQLSYTIHCTAIESGSEEAWDYLWKQTKSSNTSDVDLKTLYLSLGCARASWKLYSYLEKSVYGNIPAEYIKYVWRSIGMKDAGRLIGLKFLENNWKQIQMSAHKAYVLNAVLDEFLTKLASEEDLKKVSTLYMRYKDDLSPYSHKLKVALSMIKSRVEWKKTHMHTVLSLLKGENV